MIAEAAGCSAEHVSGGGRLTLDLFLLAVCGLSPGCFVTPEDLANDHRFGCLLVALYQSRRPEDEIRHKKCVDNLSEHNQFCSAILHF